MYCILARICLFVLGVFYIKNEKIKLNLKNYPKLKESYEPCRIIISNHVSFIDIVFYMSQISTSFISKAEV